MNPKKRAAQAAEAIRRLCRLDVDQWADRIELFGKDEDRDDWQLTMLRRLAKEKVIESGRRKYDTTTVYRVCRLGDRFRALAILTALLDKNSEMLLWNLVSTSKLHDDAWMPGNAPKPRPVMQSEPIITMIRKNPLGAIKTIKLQVTAGHMQRIEARAQERGQTVEDYLIGLLANDGLPKE